MWEAAGPSVLTTTGHPLGSHWSHRHGISLAHWAAAGRAAKSSGAPLQAGGPFCAMHLQAATASGQPWSPPEKARELTGTRGTGCGLAA